MMNKVIYFDMDGTIADLYGVENWLDYLINNDPTPYEIAKPLVNMNALARRLNNLQKKGWKIGVISWLAKNSNTDYDNKVTTAKEKWLKKHLASVNFDEIKIVPYGTPKSKAGTFKNGILFDDELNNIGEWTRNSLGTAFTPEMMWLILTMARKEMV